MSDTHNYSGAVAGSVRDERCGGWRKHTYVPCFFIRPDRDFPNPCRRAASLAMARDLA